MTSVFEYSREQLAELLSDEPRYRVDQLWHGLWDEARTIDDVSTIPKVLRNKLEERFVPALTVLADTQSDRGSTRK
ncbi:MAG TPA: hypothetical protein VGE75_03910, partial [Acidimicrobiales bacterium]